MESRTKSNYSQIFIATKKVHDKLDKHPFLARYANDQFTLRDRYRHLRELVPIYQEIEKKMRECGFESELKGDLAELLEQSKKIEADIAFLQKNSGIKFVDQPLTEETKKYIAHIKEMKDPHEVLAHFYVRILGDFHGGPLTKQHVLALFQNRNMDSKSDPTEGVKFYTFGKNASEEFHKWLNNLTLPSESFKFANDAFQKHLDIFDEIEKTRSSSSFFKTCSAFFNPQKVALVSAAVATTAISLGLYMKNT